MFGGEKEGMGSQKLARIMGKNFFGVEEWLSWYPDCLAENQSCCLPEFPWTENILNSPCPFSPDKAVRETHFAFLGLPRIHDIPLTIVQWEKLLQTTGQLIFGSRPYGMEPDVTEATCEFRWYLMPLTGIAIPNNRVDRYVYLEDDVLPREYELASAVEEVTKRILYFRRNGLYTDKVIASACRDWVYLGLRKYDPLYRLSVRNLRDDLIFVNYASILRLRAGGTLGFAASRAIPR